MKSRKSPERKALEGLVRDCETYLVALDTIMENHHLPPIERGRRIAHCSNFLNLRVDAVRYGALGLDYRTDKPIKERVAYRARKFLAAQKQEVAP